MEETQEQSNSRPWLFKKGQSGNPGGRKVGYKSLKTRAKEYLEGLDDEKAIEYFEGLNKLDVWKMAEGNPKQDTDIGGQLKVINVTVPAPVAEAFNINATNTEASTSNTQ